MFAPGLLGRANERDALGARLHAGRYPGSRHGDGCARFLPRSHKGEHLKRRRPVIDSQGHTEQLFRNGKAFLCVRKRCEMVRLVDHPWAGPCRDMPPASPDATPAMGTQAEEPTSPGRRHGVNKAGQ